MSSSSSLSPETDIHKPGSIAAPVMLVYSLKSLTTECENVRMGTRILDAHKATCNFDESLSLIHQYKADS
jgi:hypothetical protein